MGARNNALTDICTLELQLIVFFQASATYMFGASNRVHNLLASFYGILNPSC